MLLTPSLTAARPLQMTPQEALERKRTLATLEPQERVQYLHGVRRVKEWLASGYHFDYKDVSDGGATVSSTCASVNPMQGGNKRGGYCFAVTLITVISGEIPERTK